MDDQKRGSGAWLWAVVVVVIALAAYGWFAYSNKNNSTAIVNNTNTPPVTTPVDTNTPQAYKDGTYTAEGDYNSPGGSEAITVSVTLKSDVITDATVTQLRASPEAVRYQGRFIQGFKSQIIGKKITDVQLSRVSGSSLTPKGWNNAIALIQSQAKV